MFRFRRSIVLSIVLGVLLGAMCSIAFGSDEMLENGDALLELAEKYYSAVMEEDEKTLATIVEPWNDTVKEEVFALNKKFNRIDNIKTYSIDGPVDDSWLVYICCESWVDGIDVGIPTLFNPLFVISTEDNVLKISSSSEEYAEFINETILRDDVQELINDINKQYQAVMDDSAEKVRYVCNTNTKKFHYPDCQSVEQIKVGNRSDTASSRDELITQGFQPCGNCNP